VVSAVNYRAGPDNDAQRLGTVDAGRIVQVTGDTLGWKHVILPNGDRGFIYGRWLEPAGKLIAEIEARQKLSTLNG
jgi:SH3-like domain-containing protein